MAVEFKDYYKILGISRTANEEEIRKAFRKLARKYHPDVARNQPGAEDKFKEINEAYEVLSDAAKRKKYDELGPNWKQGAEFRPPPGWQNFGGGRPAGGGGSRPGEYEFQFDGTGFSDFFEQIFGGTRGGGGTGAGAPGGMGGGRRSAPRFEEQDYSERGSDVEADILVTLEEAYRGAIRAISLRRPVLCQQCFGTGQVNQRPCSNCGGSGHTEKQDTYKVKIPPGVREGQQLRVSGQGEAGVGKGLSGDLYLRVHFAKHPDFRVESDHLYYDADLAPWEAVLGTNITVPTLEGNLSIKIPPGTQSGHKLRVRGKGLPIRNGGTGDLHVVARIQVPQEVSASEKAVWEQLARESKFKPRD